MITDIRKIIRSSNVDPYFINDYNQTVGMITLKLKNTHLIGQSSFYRVGDVIVTIDNYIVTVTLQMSTQKKLLVFRNGKFVWLVGSFRKAVAFNFQLPI